VALMTVEPLRAWSYIRGSPRSVGWVSRSSRSPPRVSREDLVHLLELVVRTVDINKQNIRQFRSYINLPM
jgi:hypothetical protein